MVTAILSKYKRALLLGALLLAFLFTGCGAPPAGLGFEEVSRQFTGLRLDAYEKHQGEHHQVIAVREQRFLNALKQALREAKPASGAPVLNIWYDYTISFTLPDGREAGPYNIIYGDLILNKSVYINFPEGWYELPGQFHSLIEALEEYPSASAEVDRADEDFLRRYGWSPFFRINTLKVQLPPAFRHRPGEYPSVLYWAHNNELNKDIGLDLTPYLGRAVEVRLYKTTELLPEFMKPRREAGRAVVVRYQGQLIGAWLDAGRHYSFACSLKGRTLEEVTGKGWDEWAAGLVDPRDPAEQELARLTPEEVIRGYYEAVNRGDYAKAHAYESRRALSRYLFSNMDNNFLYKPGYMDKESDGLGNITAARVISIKKAEGLEGGLQPGRQEYGVNVNLKVKRTVTYGSGPQTRFIILSQEIPAAGWRIEGIGTGP